MQPRKESPVAPGCLRCQALMTPSSIGIARLTLTPPGRSRLGRGIKTDIYVCPRCGHVELMVSDPAAFVVREG